MTDVVPGFDDRLNEILAQQAEKAGESPEAYVRRAVVKRLVLELTEDDGSELGRLLRHLEDVRIETPSETEQPERALNDPARLEAVAKTGLMDSPREDSYDLLVRMVADSLMVPNAAVSLIDQTRQFFKSAVGLPPELEEAREVDVHQTMCQYVVDDGRPLIVEDARLNETLKNHPAVLGGLAISYMGVPLKDDEGLTVGTLCVWDQQPRAWTIGHQQILQDLAWIVRERIFG
ncbi:GAF domain-containing protein [Rhodococcus sp. G-MC3]|uniref:GAF domain-containing protein n=1 Tax=Rhodococcus sp. G-MC3 TaxID=3046209 RepID=UPI0024B9372B|nr:GAF domain-containing protein [Rhodococcus sp. G-MC3]MDJ0395789.1 GAF domain-containing protein [Rhodococcus sp. G-MC3]